MIVIEAMGTDMIHNTINYVVDVRFVVIDDAVACVTVMMQKHVNCSVLAAVATLC